MCVGQRVEVRAKGEALNYSKQKRFKTIYKEGLLMINPKALLPSHFLEVV